MKQTLTVFYKRLHEKYEENKGGKSRGNSRVSLDSLNEEKNNLSLTEEVFIAARFLLDFIRLYRCSTKPSTGYMGLFHCHFWLR